MNETDEVTNMQIALITNAISKHCNKTGREQRLKLLNALQSGDTFDIKEIHQKTGITQRAITIILRRWVRNGWAKQYPSLMDTRMSIYRLIIDEDTEPVYKHLRGSIQQEN